MSKNVLIIGSYSAEGIASFDWWQELPNISDYDVLFLDTTKILLYWSYAGRVKHLGGNGYELLNVYESDEKVRSNIDLVKQKLLEMLEFDIAIYALYSPDIIVNVRKEIPSVNSAEIHTVYDTFVNTNDWCPISIDIVRERGKTIDIKDDSYNQYFTYFRGWEFYFIPESLDMNEFETHYYGRLKTDFTMRVVATNKVNKPLAIEFTPLFYSLRKDGWGWDPNTRRAGGTLTLLPVFDEYHTESLIDTLLRRSRVVEETPLPKWVSTIEIPGEASLKSELADEKKKLESVEARIKGFQDSLSELQKYKGLLYQTGFTLQEQVKSTLEKVGANVEPSIVTDEFIIGVNGKEALIEVKGNVKSVTKDDVAQLVTDSMEHLKTTGQEIKGVLIGNGWRLEPPEQRDTRGKPIFSREAIRIAENHNIGLISTTELFKAYCNTLKQPQHKTEILGKIISGKGVIKF